MSRFEVIPLGVGDTFSAKHTTASLLLRCDGVTLAIDAPDRYRGALARASTEGDPLDLLTIDHVLITHVHGDHMNGLEGIAFFKRFAQQRRVSLYTLPEVRQPIWEHRLRAPMEQLWDGERMRAMAFDDYFAFNPIAPDAPIDVGPFRITTRRTIHHVPTSALRIEAGGRTLGYSSDTAFDPSLIDFFKGADLIVHETNHGPAHTPYSALAGLRADVREKMRLIHYADEFDVEASVIAALREAERLAV